MSLYRVGRTWYVDIQTSRGRVRRSAGTTDRKAAQEYHDKLAADSWRETRLGDASAHSWADAVKEWNALKPRGRADLSTLRAVRKKIPAATRLSEITTGRIETALEGLQGATWNRAYSTLRAVLNVAQKRGWLASVPKAEPRPTGPERVRWLTGEEWESLHACLPELHADMAMLAVQTGLRQANVLRLEWSQVDLKRKTAWVIAPRVKSRRSIGVPLNAAAMEVLERRTKNKSRWVFPGATGEPIYQPGKLWQKALTEAGIEDFRWHDLRHTWAAWHVMSGTSLQELKELGGWASFEMVLVYAHLAPDRLRAAADRLAPVNVRHTDAIPTVSNIIESIA
jgi:integrase